MVDLSDLRQNSWHWLLKRVIFPLGDLVAGQKMMRRLSYLTKAQWWEPDQIAQIRNQSLSRLMSIAHAEVPYYRELMERAGVRPEEFRVPDDFKENSCFQ